MHIAMIGGGYVGLVSGACLADIGHDVCVVEDDPVRFGALRDGRIPIFEPDLDTLVAKNTRSGRLRFENQLSRALQGADAVFLAVGTPSRRGDGHADLTHVFSAAEQIAVALRHSTVLVTKSTVPVGTGRRLVALLAELRPTCRSRSPPTRNFSGKAAQSRISCDRIVWPSAPKVRKLAPYFARSTAH